MFTLTWVVLGGWWVVGGRWWAVVGGGGTGAAVFVWRGWMDVRKAHITANRSPQINLIWPRL